ncbi:hypothetical protein C0J52_13689 [Blattella germanica]|nr:hypothetical protein C0J52_13689 [Blattella germanica]
MGNTDVNNPFHGFGPRVAAVGGERGGSRLGASLPPLREEEVAGPVCFPRDSNPHSGKTLSLGASLVAGSGREPTCADAFWKMPHKAYKDMQINANIFIAN